MADYFANKQKQQKQPQNFDLLYSDDLGALLSGAPPPVAGPPPPQEHENDVFGAGLGEAGFFLSQQQAKSNPDSDMWGNLREKEGVRSRLATPAVLTQFEKPSVKIDTQLKEASSASKEEDDESPNLEEPPNIQMTSHEPDEDGEHLQRLYGEDDEEEEGIEETRPQAYIILCLWISKMC